MRKIVSIMLALIFCMSMMTCSLSFAEEPEDGESGAAEFYATSEAYREQSFVSLYNGGKVEIPDGISAAEDKKNGGMMLHGTAGTFRTEKIVIDGAYNFDENPVGRVSVNALADKKVKASVNVYIDEEEEPLASLPIKTQMGKAGWIRECPVTASVLDKGLTGEHTVSLALDFVGLDDAEKTDVLIRSFEFAENSIPVMYFNIDESLGTISEMNSDPDHDTECYGNVDIEIPAGYKDEFKNKDLETVRGLELEYIRGRGNSTWDTEKKPYKVKFTDSQNLFNMGKNKHWVLLANRYDNSLIRNRMTYWLTRKLSENTGVFAPECVPVEVVMNGDYYGSYLLTEQIRVGKERVAIDDLEDDNGPKATEEPEISGGYLLSKDFDDESKCVSTARGEHFYIESPDFSNGHTEEAKAAQMQYLKDFLQKTEEAIFGKDFKDTFGKGYSDYLDVDAAVDYWWIQEFSENGDAYGNGSTYLYKERDKTDADGNVTEAGKLFWGPLWDFDYVAWGDLDYIVEPEEGFTSTGNPWMSRMRYDPAFSTKLRERWNVLRELFLEITKDGGVIDRYAEETRISEQYDFAKYGFYGGYSGYDYDYASDDEQSAPTESRTYDTEIKQLKDWIGKRFEWVDENLSELVIEPFTVSFKANGKVIETRTYYESDEVGELPTAPKKSGYTCVGWKDSFGDYVNPSDTVYQHMTITAHYVKNSKLVKPKDIFFASDIVYRYYSTYDDEDYYNGQDDSANIYETQYTVMPQNAYGIISWSSSDNSVATVDKRGVVTFKKSGKAKITATLPSGKKKSYTLHVLGDDEFMNDVTSFKLNKTSLKMKTGSYTQLKATSLPVPSSGYYEFISSDTRVLSVLDNGVLVAKRPGKAIVLAIETESRSFKTCTVTVTPSKAWKITQVKNSKTKIKAKKLKKGKIRLTWKKVNYASGYYIYSAAKKNGKCKKIGTVKKGKTIKWTKKIKKGKKRWYKVRPFIKSGKKAVKGKWSNAAKI